jgi:hypothetical protein
MFSDPYRRMYREMAFPSGDDAFVDVPARRDALRVLRDAADRCLEQDMRTPEVRAALDFLKDRSARADLFERFWKALSHQDVEGRRRIAFAELRVIVRQAPYFEVNSHRSDF